MKFACKICILFLLFLYSTFTRAQDTVYQEQVEQVETDTLQMYIRNAQYRQAIEYINLLEPSKDLLYQKALCYKSLNDYSNAIEILIGLSEEYPDDVPAKLQLALCYEATSLYMKSFDCYDDLLLIDSTNTYFEVRKADLLYRAERYASALEAYNRIDLSYTPNYITRCTAMCHEKLNQLDSAAYYFEKALELNEQDAYSASSLVKIFIKNEDYLTAYDYSEKFIRKDSTNATMNALNAYVYYNLEYYDLAIERFEKCLLNGDSSLIVNRSLGYIYHQTEMDSLALPLLQQAFLQDTTNNNVLYNLGQANYNLGYYPEAIGYFQKMVDNLVPSDVLVLTLYKSLAMAKEKDEAFIDALNLYSTALKYASDNTKKMDIYYLMATLSDKKLMNYTMAIPYYRQYRLCLFNYQNSLKDEQAINEIGSKLTTLDEYIRSLAEKAEQQK